MSIAVVDRGRGGAVGEIQEDRVRADRAAARVPVERRGAHALHQPAADQPQDVDLVRALAVGDAAALRDIELGGAARPRHPVGEIPGVDHADAAERAGGDDLAHPRDRQIVGMRMADLEHDAGALGGRRSSPAPARRGSPSASRSGRASSRRTPARHARDAARSASRYRPRRARASRSIDGRSGYTAAPVSAATVSRISAAGSATAASSNAGLPRIAGTKAQPAAPIPTMPMRILPDIPALRPFVWSRLPRESKLRRKHDEQETERC